MKSHRVGVCMCACLHTAVTLACICMWVAYWAASESLDFADQWLSVDGWLSALQRPPNSKHSAHCQAPRKGGHVHKFPLHSTRTHMHTRTHVLDKLMNSARGGVLDQSGTCFTTMWDRLTKTTETAERKGEKRIWEKWEAQRDKRWREWRQKGGKTRNKRENKMPNFTQEDLEHCLQNQVSCYCDGPCTGQSTTIKVVTLTGLVGSLYCQNCVCVHILVKLCVWQCPWQGRILQNQKCMKAGDSAARMVCGHVQLHDWRHTCCTHTEYFTRALGRGNPFKIFM